MDLGLSGKVAIVTGGSEGIGKAAALAMSREGARVAICARRSDVLEAAADEIRKATGGDILATSADVRDEDQVKVLVKMVVDRWGRVDVLVNNAGTSSARPFEQLTDEIWNEDIQLKVYGAIYFCRAVIPQMRAQGGGAIVNITTPTGKAPREASLPTSLSRAAGIGLTKVLSREYAAENIRVNTVCPGYVNTPMVQADIEGLANTPHRGSLHEDILPGLRHVTLGRAVIWIDIVEEKGEVRVLAVFFGGQDHFRHMLARLLAGSNSIL
jgi:3-oxoacyl-[acyl-carrier protein] reductase